MSLHLGTLSPIISTLVLYCRRNIRSLSLYYCFAIRVGSKLINHVRPTILCYMYANSLLQHTQHLTTVSCVTCKWIMMHTSSSCNQAVLRIRYGNHTYTDVSDLQDLRRTFTASSPPLRSHFLENKRFVPGSHSAATDTSLSGCARQIS